MTREQAINYLISSGFSEEQVSEVVRALTYEPTTKSDLGVDLISREQAKTAIRDKFKDLPSRVEINTILNELPSVTSQEPREAADYENEIADLYNRLDIAEYDKERLREEVTNLEAKIKALEQESKIGHWIHRTQDGGCFWEECSVCHTERAFSTKYCPDCGTYMYADIRAGEAESEEDDGNEH